MNKTLETALAEIARLPEAEQEEAAELLRLFAEHRRTPYALDKKERAAVREALAQIREGRLAASADVDAVLRQPWG